MALRVTSVLHQIDDFQEALSDLGEARVVITGQGRLQVRVMRLTLRHLRPVTVQENLPRSAFLRIPDDTVLLSFSVGSQPLPICAGIKTTADVLIVIRGGESLHARIKGAIHWCAVRFPLLEFLRFRRAVTGETSTLPGAVCAWRPPPPTRSALRRLLAATVRAAQTQAVALTMDQATPGLEQQLIHCTLQCLTAPPAIVETPTARRQPELASSFEALLPSQREGNLSASDLTRALGVSDRALRRCCEPHLGASPMSYLRLHRMQSKYRALQSGASQILRISDLAERYGFRNPSRFARAYRELFGELPSWNLQGGGQCSRRTERAARGSRKQPLID